MIVVDSDDSSEDERGDDVCGTVRPGLRPGTGGMFEFPGSIRTVTPSLILTNEKSYAFLIVCSCRNVRHICWFEFFGQGQIR